MENKRKLISFVFFFNLKSFSFVNAFDQPLLDICLIVKITNTKMPMKYFIFHKSVKGRGHLYYQISPILKIDQSKIQYRSDEYL